MKRTILKLSDFEDQAALILAASKARRGDGLRMEAIEGDEDEGAPGDDDDSDDDDDQDSGSGDDDGDDKDGDDKKDSDKKDEDDKVDRAEYERVKRHRAAADRKAADLQRQIDELKSKGSGDKDDKKDKATGPSEREVQLERERNELRVQNAFLAANTYEWHDPQDALRLADLSDVEIEDDGTVVGLKEALQKLAKDKPHLIRPSSDKDEKKGRSGSSRNGNRKGDSKKPDRAALAKTYPVLAARR